MRVTIIKDDSVVGIDGVFHKVDVSGLPATFHALQWDGTAGEVEHALTRCEHCGVRSKKPNEVITDLAPYQKYVDAAKKAAVEAAAKESANAARSKD